MSDSKVFKVFDLTGVVQGVGLRATLRMLANRAGLGGWAQNRMGCVRLRLEGGAADIEAFMRKLPNELPSFARLDSFTEIDSGLLKNGEVSGMFRILPSEW